MTIKFTKKADFDLDYFKKTGNQQIIKKIKELLESIDKGPYKGFVSLSCLNMIFQAFGREE